MVKLFKIAKSESEAHSSSSNLKWPSANFFFNWAVIYEVIRKGISSSVWTLAASAVIFSCSLSPKEESIPLADFSFENAPCNAPCEVSFTNTSTADLTEFIWDFGDGSSPSNLKNPKRVYDQSGSFTVTLKANGKNGKAEVSKVVTILGPLPKADFIINDNNSPAPGTISFTNTSINATRYLWEFGDGSSSEDKDPKHTYTVKGNYTVKLKAINNLGENLASKTVTILAGNFFKTYDVTSSSSLTPLHAVQMTDGRYHLLFQLGISYYSMVVEKNGEVDIAQSRKNLNVKDIINPIHTLSVSDGGFVIAGTDPNSINRSKMKVIKINPTQSIGSTKILKYTSGSRFSKVNALMETVKGEISLIGVDDIPKKDFTPEKSSIGLAILKANDLSIIDTTSLNAWILIDDFVIEYTEGVQGFSMSSNSNGTYSIFSEGASSIDATLRKIFLSWDGPHSNALHTRGKIINAPVLPAETKILSSNAFNFLLSLSKPATLIKTDQEGNVLDQLKNYFPADLFLEDAIVDKNNHLVICGTVFLGGKRSVYFSKLDDNLKEVMAKPNFEGIDILAVASVTQTSDNGYLIFGLKDGNNLFLIKTNKDGKIE